MDLKALLDKYAAGVCTPEEQRLVESWLDNNAAPANEWENFDESQKAEFMNSLYSDITHTIAAKEIIAQPVKKRFPKFAVAATILLLLSAGTYIYLIRTPKKIQPEIAQDAAPGHDGAILTVAGGKTFDLDSTKNVSIILPGLVNKNGALSYTEIENAIVEYHTMTTPKGRKFELILPDDTKVWMDAGSSITYPTAFTGNERKVTVSGQLYFEVAHNASKPFHAVYNDIDVQVLGTHFNINAYGDETSVKTTLLEGSVKITRGNETTLLKPGQQASVNEKIKVIAADTEETMAWKEGNFQFESADLKTMLRQFARWYDVEVVYEGAVPDRKFFVMISRSSSLSAVLKALKSNDVHFSIDGKKLIVTK